MALFISRKRLRENRWWTDLSRNIQELILMITISRKFLVSREAVIASPNICQGCRRFETPVFFSVKINISTRARRGIRDSHGMSFYDARFHQTFQCLSLNVKDQYWERDLAEHEVWLHNWRRHQVKAGAVRALERGSRLRIPRRRASPMLKSSWASASTQGWLVDIFCAWLKWD